MKPRPVERLIRCLAAATCRPQEGRPARADDAPIRFQVPGRNRRRVSRWVDGCEHQSPCTAGNFSISSRTPARPQSRYSKTSRAYRKRCLRIPIVRHVTVTGVGDLAQSRRNRWSISVVRHVRKQVPKYTIPGAVELKDVLREARGLILAPVEAAIIEDIASLQSPVAPPASRKARSSRTET